MDFGHSDPSRDAARLDSGGSDEAPTPDAHPLDGHLDAAGGPDGTADGTVDAVADGAVDAVADGASPDGAPVDAAIDAGPDAFVPYTECTGHCQEADTLTCASGWTVVKEWPTSTGCACQCFPPDGGQCVETCVCSSLPIAGGVWCIEVETQSNWYETDQYYWNSREMYVTINGVECPGGRVTCKGAWCSGCSDTFVCGVCCH